MSRLHSGMPGSNSTKRHYKHIVDQIPNGFLFSVLKQGILATNRDSTSRENTYFTKPTSGSEQLVLTTEPPHVSEAQDAKHVIVATMHRETCSGICRQLALGN